MFKTHSLHLSVSFLFILVFVQCKKEDSSTPVGNTELSMSEMLERPGMEVKLNPNGRTPLAAELFYTSYNPTRLELTVLGQEPVSVSFGTMQTENAHPVLGLYPAIENKIAVKLFDNKGNYAVDTLVVSTGPLFDALPEIEILSIENASMESGMHLSGLHLANEGSFNSQPIIFDNHGDIRYHLDLSEYGVISWPIQRAANGNFIFVNDGGIVEMGVLGKVVKTYALPNYGAHHELIELPNGNLVVAVNKWGVTINDGNGIVNSVSDHIVEVDRNSGSVVEEWDLRQLLDVDRHEVVAGSEDWFHMNAIWYSESDDCLIVSGQGQGVVKITRNNELKWILAPHKGWGKAGPEGQGPETSPFLLTAVDAGGSPYSQSVQDGDMATNDFDWSWGQHAPLIKENGNIFIFDNGLNRQYGNASQNYSRAVEYKVDEAANTITQVWEYGMSRGPETFSPIISDVDIMPATGNILFMPGIIGGDGGQARIVEVKYPSKQVVFEAKLKFKNKKGNGTFGWGQMDIVYRSERLSLYP